MTHDHRYILYMYMYIFNIYVYLGPLAGCTDSDKALPNHYARPQMTFVSED